MELSRTAQGQVAARAIPDSPCGRFCAASHSSSMPPSRAAPGRSRLSRASARPVLGGVSDFNALHSREPAQCRPLDQRAPFIGETPLNTPVSARLAQELGQGPRATSSARLAECQHGAGSEKIRRGDFAGHLDLAPGAASSPPFAMRTRLRRSWR